MSLQSKNRVVKWVDKCAEVANIQPEYEKMQPTAESTVRIN